MKTLATFHNAAGQCTGIVSGSDAYGQSVTVNGRLWRFEFDRMCGPFWYKADGTTPRKNQCPGKKVWDEFEKWHAKWLENNPERGRKRQKLDISASNAPVTRDVIHITQA